MSITKAASVSKHPSDSSMVAVLEEGLCPALQRILDTHFQSPAIQSNTLSDPEIVATAQKLLTEIKTQQDIPIANIGGSLSLIVETWLLLQSHSERQLAVVGHPVSEDGSSAIGPAKAANRKIRSSNARFVFQEALLS